MTDARLPKTLRRRVAVEKQCADLFCHLCDGTGYFTETLEGANGRDEDVDYRCGLCDGSGVER